MKKAKLSLARAFQIAQIDERVYGSFLEHIGRAVYEGIYEPDHPQADENGFRKDVLQLVRQLSVPVVRYPGGNFVSNYHWQDGVGPRPLRPRKLDLAWNSTESNQFGTNEFMQWCKAAETLPMLAVNLGLCGAEEACNLVEYCNHKGGTYWSDLRKEHGFAQPHGVKLWCLGNEMDGDWQMGSKTAYEYGRIANETAKIMKLTDPSIELVLCGSSSRSMKTFGEWEATALDLCYEKVDYISLHQYFGNQDNDTENFLAKSMELDTFINSVISICDYIQSKRKSRHVIQLSLDEWNVWYHSGEAKFEKWSEVPRILEDVYTFEDALLVGLMLISILKRADRVKVACLAQLVNVIAPIMTEKGGSAWMQTIYYPFLHMSRFGRGAALLPSLESGKHDTREFTDVPDVEAIGVWNEQAQELTVFAVNRSQTEAAVLETTLLDFDALQPLEHLEMAGYDAKQTNTKENSTVVPTKAALPIWEEGKIKAQLKPFSWNVIRMSKAE